ncbi:alanyl-tRNA synthetase [Myroides odoratimimus]|uniref:Uncharacterized protein n=1 Tax=Myroides odoratimimus CCUG 10230 TaxID=883150 RepID=A0ABN0EAW2_9FLAO|nr:hypothetical protein HMPREF9712_01580 [Myroides odoratimimus CCUG 10230]GAQ14929.1 alanyl-tRNA synthetase [Myroides odoratimimus]STZ49158.1 Uncharacterised protein [Myroides odoratimimus]
MVQLKVIPKEEPVDVFYVFQYLYGAVKRVSAGKTHIGTYTFQYLYGAVKSKNSRFKASEIKIFQYLYGAVKRIIISPLSGL